MRSQASIEETRNDRGPKLIEEESMTDKSKIDRDTNVIEEPRTGQQSMNNVCIFVGSPKVMNEWCTKNDFTATNGSMRISN